MFTLLSNSRYFHGLRGFSILKRNLNELSLITLLFKEHGNLIISAGHSYLAVRDLLSDSLPCLDNRDKKAGLQRFHAN